MAKKTDPKPSFFLPVSRRKQIGFFLKTNLPLLFRLSLLLFLFALPSFLALFISLTLQGAIMSQYASDASAQWVNLMAFRRWMGLAIIPCGMVFSLGVAGASRVYRRLLFNEGVFLREDFKLGIRKNWKGNLVQGFLSSLLCCLLYASLTFYGEEAVGFYLFSFVLIGLLYLLLISVNWYFAFVNDLYTDPLGKKIRVSCVLLFKNVVSFLLVASLGALPLVAFFVLEGVSFLAAAILLAASALFYPLLGFGLTGLIASAMASSSADEAIHKKHFPSYYEKGLFQGEHLK